MNDAHLSLLAEEFKIPLAQVKATATLIAEGATVPFIARYRKEATGGLDEVVISGVRDRLDQFAELDKRREAILKSLSRRPDSCVFPIPSILSMRAPFTRRVTASSIQWPRTRIAR
jgi:hypothetical protein